MRCLISPWRAVWIALVALALAGGAGRASAERLERSVVHDGRERTYIVHLPPDPGARDAWPVIFAFHPGWATGRWMERTTRLQDEPGGENYVVVYPDGYRRAWNAGYCCGAPRAQGVDDVGLVPAILEDLATLIPVQPKVFVTGFSNGAMLSYRLMCERSDLIAAAAPYGAVLDLRRTPCNPRNPVPVLHMHGLLDLRAPFGGGVTDNEEASPHQPVEDVVAFWAARDQCGRVGEMDLLEGATCRAHAGCAGGAEVVLCAIPGLGHNWPGERMTLAARAMDMGPARTDVDGSGAVIAFFDRHR